MPESRNYKMQIIYRGNKKSKKECKKPATTCDITTWVKDPMNAHTLIDNILLFFFLNVSCKFKMGPPSSKNYSLTTLGEKERRIGGK